MLVALVATACTRNSDSTPIPTELPRPTRSVPVQSPTNPFDLVSTVFAPTATVVIADTSTPQPTPTQSPTPFPAGWEAVELPEEIGPNAEIYPLPGGQALIIDPDRDRTLFNQYVLDPGSGDVRLIDDLVLPSNYLPSQLPFQLDDGRLVMLGGTGFRATFIFDPTTETWSAGPTLTIDRFPNDAAIRVNGKEIAVIGQFNTAPFASAVEVFDESSNVVATIPIEPNTPDEANALDRFAARLPDARLLILEERSGLPPAVVIVDVESRTSEYLESGPSEFNEAHHPTQSLADGRVLVVPGNNIPSLIFDPADEKWDEVAAVPYGWITLNRPLGFLPSGESVWSSSIVFVYSVSDDEWLIIEMPAGAGISSSSLGTPKIALTSDGELVALQQRGFPIKTTAWIMRDPLAHAVPADEWRGAPGGN